MYKCFFVDESDPDFHEKINKSLAMWYCPWYFDPKVDDKELMTPMLSAHYRNDWADVRPPIAVRCPNGQIWVIDAVSSNGTGWAVLGEVPNITCSPSIVVPGYHGFLRDGFFTPDLENR